MSTRSQPLAEPTHSPSPNLKAPLDRHELECRIQRDLQAHPSLRFSRLTVHQGPNGICLEGMLESNEEGIDLCELVRQMTPVNVINHVVNQPMRHV